MSRALLLVLALLTCSSAAAQEAVAVMPFRNLNADPALEWLSLGIAETMISDLKRLGRTVVERDQIDRALAELLLQGEQGSEESTAAKLGRLVGARTVVVGGFQQAGGKLRITARFVSVETGVVEDTAKATGALARVFDLQDEIVARLVGEPPRGGEGKGKAKAKPPPRPRARKEKPGGETIEAYRLYSMSLKTSSDAERVRFLKDALAADPEFSYAVEELRHLEARMRGYARKDQDARDAAADETRRLLASADLGDQDRATRAMQLLTSDMAAMRWRKLLDDCAFVVEQKIPAFPGGMTFDEMCSHYRFLALVQLKRVDEAMAQGERHLARYPGSSTFSSVKMQMQAVIDERRNRASRVAELDRELAEIEAERAERKARRNADPVEADRHADWRRCAEAHGHAAYARAIVECRRYLELHRGEPNPYDAEALARFFIAMASYEQGDFARARAEMERLIDEEQAFAQKMHLQQMLNVWPRD